MTARTGVNGRNPEKEEQMAFKSSISVFQSGPLLPLEPYSLMLFIANLGFSSPMGLAQDLLWLG